MTGTDPGGGAAEVTGPPVCSAKGCRADASHLVVWRNPAIHAAGRRKTWPACDDHVEHLSRFLRARSFPVEVTAVPAEGRRAG
jgi:hypothetical protein